MGKLVMVIGGSPATHGLGEIGREKDDYFVVQGERDDVVVGNWLFGFGFIGVQVNKEHIRKLTHAEADHLHGGGVAIGKSVICPITVESDEVEDGWVPKEETLADVKPTAIRYEYDEETDEFIVDPKEQSGNVIHVTGPDQDGLYRYDVSIDDFGYVIGAMCRLFASMLLVPGLKMELTGEKH